jgi:opacity protein-like surface antigen
MYSSTPVIQPYLTGGYVVRERKVNDASEKRVGMAVGVGLRTTETLRVQVEATWEFLGHRLNQWVVRIGLGL